VEIRVNPWPLYYWQKKTGLVGPASHRVELRCGYITARRMLAPKGASGRFWPDLFGCNYSRQPKNQKDAERRFHVQTPFQFMSSSVTRWNPA
jgi:hypothetical protein